MPDENMEGFDFEAQPQGVGDLDIDLAIGDGGDGFPDFELDTSNLGDLQQPMSATKDGAMVDHMAGGSGGAGLDFGSLGQGFNDDLGNLGDASVDWHGDDGTGAANQKMDHQGDEIDYNEHDTGTNHQTGGMDESAQHGEGGVEETLGQAAEYTAESLLGDGGDYPAGDAGNEELDVNVNHAEGGQDEDLEEDEDDEDDGDEAAEAEEEEEVEGEDAEEGEDVEEEEDAEEDDEESEESPGSADEASPRVVVHYLANEYTLFAESDEDDPNDFFLSDKSVLSEPLDRFFASLREVISQEIPPQHELLMKVDGLGLEIGEVSVCNCSEMRAAADLLQTMTKDFLGHTTFGEILNLHDRLLKNDGNNEYRPLYLALETRLNCVERFQMLRDAANRGKGLSQVAHYFKAEETSATTNGGMGAHAPTSKTAEAEEEDEDDEEEEEYDEEAGAAEEHHADSHPTADSHEELVVEEIKAPEEEELIDYSEDEEHVDQGAGGSPATGKAPFSVQPCGRPDSPNCLCTDSSFELLFSDSKGENDASTGHLARPSRRLSGHVGISGNLTSAAAMKLAPDSPEEANTNRFQGAQDQQANTNPATAEGSTTEAVEAGETGDDAYVEYVDEGDNEGDNEDELDQRGSAEEVEVVEIETTDGQGAPGSKVTASSITSTTTTVNGEEEIGYDEDDQEANAAEGATMDASAGDEITWEIEDVTEDASAEDTELQGKGTGSPGAKRPREEDVEVEGETGKLKWHTRPEEGRKPCPNASAFYRLQAPSVLIT